MTYFPQRQRTGIHPVARVLLSACKGLWIFSAAVALAFARVAWMCTLLTFRAMLWLIKVWIS